MTSNRRHPEPASDQGVYGISVTSELSGIGPQTLRITELVCLGLNLAGIAQILELENKNSRLQTDYTQLELLNAWLKANRTPPKT
ncbi:hypothetical protein [Mycobacterium sp.]|uniref:hypothetical protein n=1 Tax=Mycobacterium sp. TaxID=1785 RepID=UPI003F9B35D4